MFNKNLVLISGACTFREVKGQNRWFLIKLPDLEEWEIPKVLVRKGESSVRAALRMMGEKGGMTTRVLEEAGRAGGVTTINGRTFPQRHIYYLMVAKSMAGEAIGFEVVDIATRRLDRDRRMMPARRGRKPSSQIEERMHEEYVIGYYKPDA